MLLFLYLRGYNSMAKIFCVVALLCSALSAAAFASGNWVHGTVFAACVICCAHTVFQRWSIDRLDAENEKEKARSK